MRIEEKFIDQKSSYVSDLQIDHLNLDNSVRNNEKHFFLNQYAVTLEVHNQLRNYSRKSERENSIRNHPSIHGNIIISAMNVTDRNHIRASDVDLRIISSKNFQNRTLQTRKFTRTRKNLKLVCTDQ